MKLLFAALSFIVLLSSCQTIKYVADYNSSHDFTPYKTYNFMQWNPANNKYLNGIDKERVLSNVEMEMTRLGFTKSNTPDLMVNVNVIIEEKTGTQAYTTYMGGYYSPYGYGVTTYQEYSYLVGSLVIDLFNEKSKQLAWQGAAMGEIDENKERDPENIKRVVTRIMNKYPIQPEK